MADRQRATASTLRLTACVALVCSAALLVPTNEALAKNRGARVSQDLKTRLQAGDNADTSVIITGSKATVDAIAARHGLRIRKRLKSGAVVDVPAGGLAGLTEDGNVDAISSN